MKYLLIVLWWCGFVMCAYGQGLLIKSSRTISFETAVGTHMDVDISPDGKSVVFDLLGDIYVIPSSGGNAVQLTRGMAWNRSPVWSHNGKEIAYRSDVSGAVHINVMNADGSFQHTLGSSEHQIAIHELEGDKDLLVWTEDDNYIAEFDHLHHVLGGTVPLQREINNVIQFSQDGRFIYYYIENSTDITVQQYNRQTGLITKIANLPDHSLNLRMSNNGQWLSYVTESNPEGSLMVRDIFSGRDRILVPHLESGYRKMQEHYGFSADSKFIFAGYRGKIHKIDIETGDDYIIPFLAQVHVDMGAFDYNTYRLKSDSLQVRYTRSANTRPDGLQLVFSALNRVYVMDLPNGTPHVLVKQSFGQYQPIYSPDGKWIAYVTRSDTKGGALWRVPAKGGNPEKLTSDTLAAIYAEPTWSPDGSRLAILRDTSNQWILGIVSKWVLGELQLISVNDHSMEKVVDSIPMENSLAFSSDGNRIAFVPRESESFPVPTLVSVDLNGKNLHRLTVMSGLRTPSQLVEPEGSDRIPMTISPDNKYAVYEINDDLYLSPIPDETSLPVVISRDGTLPIIKFSDGGRDIHWENGGKTFCWSYGNQFFRVDPAKIILAASESEKDSACYNSGIMKVNVIPDETIAMKIKVTRNYARGTVVLQNARIISMRGDEIIEQGTIVIRDGRINAIGSLDKVKIPSGAKVIDLKGKTIIPGLIDLHDHMEPSESVFEQQSWEFLANLAYGVTTARNPSVDFDSFGYSELIETGQMIGPRLFTVGQCVKHSLESLEDARSVVRKRATMGATYIKQYHQPTRLQKQWLITASTEYGLNMTNEGDFDMEGSLAMMKDGSTGVEHNPFWGNIYNDVLEFISKAGTWHTPTLQVSRGGVDGHSYFRWLFSKSPDKKAANFWPKDRYEGFIKHPYPAKPDSASPDIVLVSKVEANIRKHGGHITMGAHGNDAGIGSQWELWALQMGGLTNLEALQEATIEGARALGMQQDLGSIEPGKMADIVLDKNPLDDIHNTASIRFVMKAGVIYDGNTLDELWPQTKKLPAWRFVPKKRKN